MRNITESTQGYLATVATVLIIGFSFLFVKLTLQHAHPLDALAQRFCAALVGILPFAFWKRAELTYNKKEIPVLTGMALLYPGFSFGFQILGLRYISSAEAGILQAVQPLQTMAIAALLLHERINTKQGVFAILSVSSILFIIISQGIETVSGFTGYLYFLLSVTAMSLYVVLVRKVKNRFTAFRLTFFCITSGAITFTLLSVTNHFLAGEYASFFKPLYSSAYLGATLYLGILSSLLTLALTNYAYARVEASKLGVFSNLVPVIAIFAGVVIMHDPFNWVHILCSILTFIGVAGVSLFATPSQASPR